MAGSISRTLALTLFRHPVRSPQPYLPLSSEVTANTHAPGSTDLHGYLTQQWVQRALGVPINYTALSPAVGQGFDATGDFSTSGQLGALAYLLDSGVKVSLVYGDRDFAGNWLGGERASLAVPHAAADTFRAAAGDEVGYVRQHANFSFARVFQAGHQAPSYAPAATYAIFMRALRGLDIATGVHRAGDDFVTAGPSSTWHITNEVETPPRPTCYILDPTTCTPDVYAAVKNGSALVRDFIVVEGREGREG